MTESINTTIRTKAEIYIKDKIKDMYLYSSKGINNKDPKFKIDEIVRISKYKNIFAKGYTPN